jgi:hypothetical protein
MFTKLHMCKSIKIKEAQNYEATAGTRTAGQLKCTYMRYLTVILARIASESSRAPSRQGKRYRLFNGKAVYPHPGLSENSFDNITTATAICHMSPRDVGKF